MGCFGQSPASAQPRDDASMTPRELARELGISPKKLRSWLRTTYPRHPSEHGQSWYLSEAQADAAREHFGAGSKYTLGTTSYSPPATASTRIDLSAQYSNIQVSQINWQWCQQKATQILASGCRYLLNQPLKSLSDLASAPGIYQFCDKYHHSLYVGQSSNIRQRVRSHIKSNPQLSQNAHGIRELTIEFGRLELEEFAISYLQPPYNTSRKGQSSRHLLANKKTQDTLWKRCQMQSRTLIEQGIAQALDIPAKPWFGTLLSTEAGGYILYEQDGKALYVGETHNIAERCGSHQTDTYFSALRRNAGRTQLGLSFAPGSRRRFSAKDDEGVSSYLAGCSLAVIPISIGRGELESGLIRHLDPLLNRRR